MTAVTLSDTAIRRRAFTDLSATMLVEAGAGSGKTSLMAGRVIAMLASGVHPKNIAAVSFTEKAASELLERILRLMEELEVGRVPRDLIEAFPVSGPTEEQQTQLARARVCLNELVTTTIHGFCQRLIKPYPVEANIDPGAAIMDPGEAALLFDELFEEWIRERLSGEDGTGSIIADLIAFDPDEVVGTLRSIAETLRDHRDADAIKATLGTDPCGAFRTAVEGFDAFMQGCGGIEPESVLVVAGLKEMAHEWRELTGKSDFEASVRIIRASIWPEAVFTGSGTFRAYQKSTKWQTVATSKAAGKQLFLEANALYAACKQAHSLLRATAAACLLAHLVDEVKPLVARYQQAKRRAAALDFNDLQHAARDMLAGHETIRTALAERYQVILVDEFQDTDPLQCEIFQRIAGSPPTERPDAPLTDWGWREGGLFLVGDPKQAIYRFRGADVATYLAARDRMRRLSDNSVVSIDVNFRSVRSILEWVNHHFDAPLSVDDQPGFIRLAHFHEDHGRGPAVTAITLGAAEGNANTLRDAEAAAVAEFCARIVGSYVISDRKTGISRPCEPGDIALLAPMGTDLWRYEAALEEKGLSVATQAGKGLFRRQEIQDLIALTRVLADPRDSLAFGALLRGPLVGLTEEELLDMLEALPQGEERGRPLLSRQIDPDQVPNEVAARTLRKIQTLALLARRTTPYDVLSQAIDELQVRAIIRARYAGDPERALANVDRFIEMARTYSVRGLRAFSDDMARSWNDNEKLQEGRPDAEEQSVSIITMHSAKGLQWPIVIPVNSRTKLMPAPSLVFNASTRQMSMKLFGVEPVGHEENKAVYEANVSAERVRLWYVATTRAEDLLVMPRFSEPSLKQDWSNVVDFALNELPEFDLTPFPPKSYLHAAGATNTETAASFHADTLRIRERRTVTWKTPSRHEETAKPTFIVDDMASFVDDPLEDRSVVKGSARRGIVLHKLMEEVIGGETADDAASLKERATTLGAQLVRRGETLETTDLDPNELAASVVRTLGLPAVNALRHRLHAEMPVAASWHGEAESATYGVADAVAVTDEGLIDVVVDWKSDVEPTSSMTALYRAQVADYLKTVSAGRGLIVFMTTGKIVEVDA